LIDMISESDANDLKLTTVFQKELKAFEIPPDENTFYFERKLNQFNSNAQYNEIEFLNFVEKFAIVSDQPGAGKSKLFKNLAKLCKQNFPFSLVFKIDLNSPALKLDELQDLNLDSSDFEDFVLKNIIGAKSQLESSIFNYFAEHDQKKIHLFLDGFDEISLTYKETVLKLIKYFIRLKSTKLFVSTRPVMALYLQDEFKGLSSFFFSLEPLTKSESEKFLLAICEKPLLNLTFQINIFLGPHRFASQDPELTGNPLILTMAAKILNDEDYGLRQFENEWEIFKKFVDIKNQTFLEDLDPRIGPALQIDVNTVGNIEKYLENLALRVILGDDLCQKFGVEILDESYQMKNIIVKHGLIKTEHQFNQVSFIHRRFAEFYASKFFVRNLTKVDIEPIITNVSYQGLTDMIIYAISEKSTLNHIFLKSYLDTCKDLVNSTNFRTSVIPLFARNSETDRKLGDIKTLNDIIEQLKSENIDLGKFCENIVSRSFEFYLKDTINTRAKKIEIFENHKIYAVYNGASYCTRSYKRYLNEFDLEDMEKVGLIYKENDEYEFVHEIFANYFQTLKLKDNIH
jgi:hypothetical protein